MATYNTDSYIALAIQSVLDQNYESWELLIIDDGSTDSTRVRASEFKDPRISYYYQNNAGPAIARQAGVKLARGEYIVFFDSDDILRPDALERLISPLVADTQVCVAYGDEIFMREDGVLIGSENKPRYSPRPSGFILENLLRENFIFNGASCIRRSCLEKVGHFYAGKLSEDWHLWCKLAVLGKFEYIGEGPILQYRLRGDSLVRTLGTRLDLLLGVIDDIFNDDDILLRVSNSQLKLLRRKREVAAYAFSAKHAISSKHYLKGFTMGIKALLKDLLNPFPLELPRLVLRTWERRTRR